MTVYRKSGFTLFECVLVCFLFSISIGLAMTTYGFFTRALIASELNKLHATCRYLQQCAQVDNSSYTLTFDSINNTYMFEDKTVALPSKLVFGFLPATLGPPSSPHTLLTTPITFNNHCITFTPHGIIQPGTVYMVDTLHQHMYALSCSVAQVSYIRKYRYEGTWTLIT